MMVLGFYEKFVLSKGGLRRLAKTASRYTSGFGLRHNSYTIGSDTLAKMVTVALVRY
ncbi:hypothetical protein Sdel_0459 [Sulfurospirillum deleyianum DSM 6946]|uniref:Uncharacterized protein n=1 Tax=Sulfurospirillum deleyianum (strain ATCC 51133 / DSM 6946 / 5175) TaxID=525898 RepID=D1AZM9_SULD5|nr:hypothetical protein Sdel_0459 [Sulfurospirillum deleyianum DSM 6946]